MAGPSWVDITLCITWLGLSWLGSSPSLRLFSHMQPLMDASEGELCVPNISTSIRWLSLPSQSSVLKSHPGHTLPWTVQSSDRMLLLLSLLFCTWLDGAWSPWPRHATRSNQGMAKSHEGQGQCPHGLVL